MRRALAVLTAAATISTAIIIATGPAQAAGPRSAIDWQPCPDAPGVECGTLTVPVDWSRPGGPTIDLALARRKAAVPAERIGSIVVNPGGPGGAGAGLVKQTQFLSDDVARRFDIVGFDPRGVGQSSPILCDRAISEEQFPVEPQNQAEFEQMVDHNRRYGESCRALSGPVFDFVDSVSVARDIDAIRAAVGDSKLTYYGVSYGTLMGQMYAELFPDRVRALVLDSNMDHSLPTAFHFMRTETVGFEESYEEFAKWNERTPDSPLAGQDARAVYRELLARAERGELKLPDGTPVSALDFRFRTFGSFYGPSWRSLAQAYALLQSTGTADAGPFGLRQETVADPFQAVFCQDWRLPLRNYYELAAYRAVLQRTVAPTVESSPLGELATTACQGWPDRTTNPQHVLRVRSKQPILMVNSRFDPATPYQWATNAASQSRSFVLLHYDGWGHGAYFAGSSCVTGAVDTYLFTRRTPPRDTHCPAVPPPDSFGALGGVKVPTAPRW
ncbi:alpha/beta hydrolase [Allorhizocola rhizosphaerae]|uniref:alpha/beta hydrolase n=1 Tax=Allorhizocola rhizosphaerae TaxID=1872709 RepID=UPI000E3CE3A7|nr:alpha/beta hydrolase [Allorhizocola rhizosphaerae]